MSHALEHKSPQKSDGSFKIHAVFLGGFDRSFRGLLEQHRRGIS